jgi:hypothetical protein
LLIGPACLTGPPAPTGSLNLLAPSSAPCLVALFHATSALGVAPFRALLLPCSRTPSPTPDALLSFRRTRTTASRAPQTAETDHRTLPHAASPTKADEHRPKPAATGPKGPPATSRVPIQARERPRLQGFAPHESPPPTAGGLDRRRARSSLGLHSLQGSLPRWNRTAFTALPLMGFSVRAQATERPALQGLASSEIGSPLSRLPALLGFAAF